MQKANLYEGFEKEGGVLDKAGHFEGIYTLTPDKVDYGRNNPQWGVQLWENNVRSS